MLELRLMMIHMSLREIMSNFIRHRKLRRLDNQRLLRVFLLISRFFLANNLVYSEAVLLNLTGILEVVVKLTDLLQNRIPFINCYHYSLRRCSSEVSYLEVQEDGRVVFENKDLLGNEVLYVILACIIVLVQQVVHETELVLENLSLV